MRLFKTGVILQCIYFLCCLIVVVCMPLYSMFHTTIFGKICFRIGGIFIALSTINPCGIIGAIMSACGCGRADLKGRKPYVAAAIVLPLLIPLSWLGAVCVFVYCSGGV